MQMLRHQLAALSSYSCSASAVTKKHISERALLAGQFGLHQIPEVCAEHQGIGQVFLQAWSAAVKHATPNYVAIACDFHFLPTAFLEAHKRFVRASPSHAAVTPFQFDGAALDDARVSGCAQPFLVQPMMCLFIRLFRHPFKDGNGPSAVFLLSPGHAHMAFGRGIALGGSNSAAPRPFF